MSLLPLAIRALRQNTNQRVQYLQRTMSTTSSPVRRFLVYAPDSTNEGTLELRYKVREKHLSAVQPYIDNGTIQVAGIWTTPESVDLVGTDRKALGSILIIKADTLEEVKKLMESDIYYTSGVWDKEKMSILPWFPTTPFPA